MIWHSCSFLNICSGTLKVKGILKGQMIKWSKIVFVWAITSTFIHGFQNESAQLFLFR